MDIKRVGDVSSVKWSHLVHQYLSDKQHLLQVCLILLQETD